MTTRRSHTEAAPVAVRADDLDAIALAVAHKHATGGGGPRSPGAGVPSTRRPRRGDTLRLCGLAYLIAVRRVSKVPGK